MDLYERAVQLAPSSADALAGLASALLNDLNLNGRDQTPATIRRAEGLLAKAEELQPADYVMGLRGYLLRTEGRCTKAIGILEKLIDADPNDWNGYYNLGVCLTRLGRPAEAVPRFERSIRLNPRSPWISGPYEQLGTALLFLGRYDDAVTWKQRSIAASPGGDASFLASQYIDIAAAHALAGRMQEARAAGAEATRLWPTMTVRSLRGSIRVNPAFAVQMAHIQEALALCTWITWPERRQRRPALGPSGPPIS